MAGRDIKITIVGDASKAQKAFADAGTSAGTFETKVEGLGSKFGTFAGTMAGVVTGGALAALPGLLMDGAKGAAEDEAAMLRLQQAVKNSGKSYEDYSKAVDEQIKKGQDLAFTDGETADALSTLISLTGDTDEGMRRLSAAQDLARGTGISLEQAAKLLGKTSDENTAALGRLGIQVGENATAQDVLNAVDEKFKGQAGVFAESQAGQMLKAQQATGELAESFGSLLLPVIALLTAGLLKISEAIQTYVVPAMQGIMAAVMPVAEFIGGFIVDNIGPFVAALAGIGVVILATVIPALIAWVAGMVPVIASHVAMAAAVVVAYAPIIAIMVVVGAAAAALYIAWQENLFGIQDITQKVIDFIWPYIQTGITNIVTAVQTGLAIVQEVWNVVFPAIQAVVETVMPIIATVATTYIGILKTEIELAINAVKWVFDNVFVPIQGIVSDVFSTIATLVTTLFDPAMTAIKTGVDAAKAAFDLGFVPIQGVVSDVFNTIVGLVNSLWLGATGAVSLVGAGLGTLKGFFADVYTTFKGYGEDIMNGLIDGVKGLYNTLKGWFDDITGLMDIDVPGFSPPYDAGYKQGLAFMRGLETGVRQGTPGYEDALGTVADGMGSAYTGGGSTGGPGQGNTGGGYTGPDDFYYERPPNQSPTPSPVIGDPAFGLNNSGGYFANPQNVGGGKNLGAGGGRGGRTLSDADVEAIAKAVERGASRGTQRALAGAI